jgi:hypothetical protein
MTRTLITTLALALVAAVALASPRDQPRVAVVLSGPAAQRPELLSAARAAHADVRVPRSAAEQLGVTHLLAAERYGTVVAIGVDRRVAIDPVAARYPGTRFVEAQPDARAIARAIG